MVGTNSTADHDFRAENERLRRRVEELEECLHIARDVATSVWRQAGLEQAEV